MKDLLFVDFETTGLDPFVDEVVEISMLRKSHDEIVNGDFSIDDVHMIRVMPEHPERAFMIPPGMKMSAAHINGFSVERWREERYLHQLHTWEQAIHESIQYMYNTKWCGMNAQFDYFFYLSLNCRNRVISPKLGDYHLLDLLSIGHIMLANDQISKLSLDNMLEYFDFRRSSEIHTSIEDVYLSAALYQMLSKYTSIDIPF
jgi:DNA polymerase III epsilon subunit-like protein